jgi:hypothetical protein
MRFRREAKRPAANPIPKQSWVLSQHPPTQINTRAVLNQGQKNKYRNQRNKHLNSAIH